MITEPSLCQAGKVQDYASVPARLPRRSPPLAITAQNFRPCQRKTIALTRLPRWSRPLVSSLLITLWYLTPADAAP